jgi:hypothetical protein
MLINLFSSLLQLRAIKLQYERIFLMRIVLVMLLFGAFGFSSCDTKNANITRNTNSSSTTNSNLTFVPPTPIKPTQPVEASFKSCNPYFPLVPGSLTRFTLQFASPLVADVTVVVSQVDENGRKVFVEQTQIIDKSGGFQKTELTERKYICDNGRIQIIYEKADNRTEKGSSIGDTSFRNVATFMVDPASLGRKGTTWSYGFDVTFQRPNEPPLKTDAVTINFETQGEEEVKVPAGTFRAIKIVRKIRDVFVNEYYVPGLGLVKRVNKDGTTWELKEFSGLRPV